MEAQEFCGLQPQEIGRHRRQNSAPVLREMVIKYMSVLWNLLTLIDGFVFEICHALISYMTMHWDQ